MPSTYTPRLRVEKQALGENNNSWGDARLNRALEGLEEGIAGIATITIVSSDITLTSSNASADQARMAVLRLDGTPASSQSIIVPGVQKTYQVHNTTGTPHTVKTASGSGAVVGAGRITFIYCDGTNCYSQDVTADLSSYLTIANASGNRLINDGRVMQRPDVSVADGQFGAADRWYGLTDTGVISTFGGRPTAGMHPFVQVIARSGGSQRIGIAQIIDTPDCQDLAGSPVTLSGNLYLGSMATTGVYRYAILAWQTLPSPARDVVNNWASTNYTPGNFFISDVTVVATGSTNVGTKQVKVPFTLTGTAPSDVYYMAVVFWSNMTVPVNNSFHVSAQLEKGSAATARQTRLYGDELALCQRYYRVMRTCVTGQGTTSWGTSAPLNYEMRAVPSHGIVMVSSANVATVSVDNKTSTFGRFQVTATTNGALSYIADVTLDAEL